MKSTVMYIEQLMKLLMVLLQNSISVMCKETYSGGVSNAVRIGSCVTRFGDRLNLNHAYVAIGKGGKTVICVYSYLWSGITVQNDDLR